MTEISFFDLVKSYQVRKNGPIVVVVPKEIREKLGIKAGTKFLVSYDKQKRLIFTRAELDEK